MRAEREPSWEDGPRQDRVVTPPPADVLLTDGTVACIRPLAASDEGELRALHDAMGEDAVRLRFFTVNRSAGKNYVRHLATGTGDTVLALVAVLRNSIVALATAERVSHEEAEVAFLVADEVRGHGVGSLLLEHLAAGCRARGIRRFVADVLWDNDTMVRVFRDAGFTLSRTAADGVVTFEISTAATPEALRAADLRESHSEEVSLRPLLYPTSVAVVGVRRDGGGIGHAVLRSIRDGGFTGTLQVVHPSASSVEGLPTYASLSDVPGKVDLVVIAVPATAVLQTLEDAAAAGVSSAVIISSGFSELGPQGAQLQRDLLRIAREHSIRLVGPNCLGLLSNDPGIRLNATFASASPPHGGLAIASQSGGVGIAMLDVAQNLGLGVHTFVSLGNKADVSSNDLLAAWYDDAGVAAAALYLESFGNARKFARIARRFAERKPLLAVVGGRSLGGARAGQSHTAAATTPAVGVDALFAQAGVIACRSGESMARAALLLTEQPLPSGTRVGIISNAGGIGVLAADAADERGLVVPEFSARLKGRLRSHVAGTVGTSNPIDLGAGADVRHLREVVTAVLTSGEVDVLLVALVATNVTDPRPLAAALDGLRDQNPDVPMVLVAMGGLEVPRGRHRGPTVFGNPDDALEAIAHAIRYAEWLRIPHDERFDSDPDRAASARETARAVLAAAETGETWLSPDRASELLAPFGLAPVGDLATNPLAAADAAARIGFPVAVKVADETVVHKTDRGLVRVGLRSTAEVLATVRAFGLELHRDDVPVLVQPVVTGVELALGLVRDPGFGPLVMVAAGGIATGVWNDRAFLLPPVTARDAARALRSLRIWPLLDGYRGGDRVDVDGLVHLIEDLGQLATDVPEIAELDLNPVMARPQGAVLVDVKVRLGENPPTNDGVPRQLRRS